MKLLSPFDSKAKDVKDLQFITSNGTVGILSNGTHDHYSIAFRKDPSATDIELWCRTKSFPIEKSGRVGRDCKTVFSTFKFIYDKSVTTYSMGDVSFTLPEGWKINNGTYSTQDDEYFTLYSPDLEPPFPEGSGIGAVIHIRRQKTELTDTRCDPNEKISDEFERGITSDIKCIMINGKDIKSNHLDYEGHYLIYKFIHKGSIYTFNLQTSGVLKTEKKYLPFLESTINSINFK